MSLLYDAAADRIDDLVIDWRAKQTILDCDASNSLAETEKQRLIAAERMLFAIQRVPLKAGVS